MSQSSDAQSQQIAVLQDLLDQRRPGFLPAPGSTTNPAGSLPRGSRPRRQRQSQLSLSLFRLQLLTVQQDRQGGHALGLDQERVHGLQDVDGVLEVVVLVLRMIDRPNGGNEWPELGFELFDGDLGVFGHALDAEEGFKDDEGAFEKFVRGEIVWFKVPARKLIDETPTSRRMQWERPSRTLKRNFRFGTVGVAKEVKKKTYEVK